METVLIIDDEKPTLSMFNLLLSAYGYKVLTAENGEAGIKLFHQESPSIVFTDIKMPGIDGLAVLKRLKQIDPTVPIIVMTGHGDQDLTRQAMELKATAFIHKPIQRAALEEALRRAANTLLSDG